MPHLITHKGIIHNRYDAPFLGSLLIAKDCHRNCPNCCNQHLKGDQVPTVQEYPKDIIDKILDYKFSDGIILAGLSWIEAYDDLISVLDYIYDNSIPLEVILYTEETEDSIQKSYPHLLTYKGLYIKYGPYLEALKDDYHFSEGVKLASTNQYIKRVP